MRHNRRRVMSEHYKLYMRKNIFNGRYFVRNLQITLCTLTVVAVMVITGFLVTVDNHDEDQKIVAQADKSVKTSLIANNEEEKVDDNMVASERKIVIKNEEESFSEFEEQEEKTEFDNKCIANVEETLNIRKEPSTESEFVGIMKSGAIAIVEGTEGEWTKIKSGEVEGYVLTEYVLTGKRAEEFAKDYVTLSGTILDDGVNVREEKSPEANIVTILNKNDKVVVTDSLEFMEENAEKINFNKEDEQEMDSVMDSSKQKNMTEQQSFNSVSNNVEEIVWLEVVLQDGKVGYISSEFVSIEKLYEIAVSAEELQRIEAERIAAEKAAAERAAAEKAAAQKAAAEKAAAEKAAAEKAAAENSSNSGNVTASTTPQSGEYLGTFVVTAYCGCTKCTSGSGVTASGTIPTEGRTIAADLSVLPFGTKVVIDGVVYTVEDRGSAVRGNHIDIFFSTHQKAVAFGRRTIKVYKY